MHLRVGTPRLGINFSHATLHFMHFSVESRCKNLTELFVQSPKFVNAHPCEINILHISSPGLASNKGRDKGGKNDG
jgi:hypothetical protein